MIWSQDWSAKPNENRNHTEQPIRVVGRAIINCLFDWSRYFYFDELPSDIYKANYVHSMYCYEYLNEVEIITCVLTRMFCLETITMFRTVIQLKYVILPIQEIPLWRLHTHNTISYHVNNRISYTGKTASLYWINTHFIVKLLSVVMAYCWLVSNHCPNHCCLSTICW